jgi:D-3-phosphoglycerate dehydrogenase / 2-oxoglutarate reductase
MKLLIAEAAGFSGEALRRLREVLDVETGDLSREELLKSVRAVDILWVRLRTRIDSEVMDAAPHLRIVVTNTTGLDHVDLEEAARRNIRIVSLRGESVFLNTVTATAELTLALLLALVRRVPAAVAHARDGGWDRYPFKGVDLAGKTAGVVGFGRVGRMVGRLLAAFGMRVLVTGKDSDTCPPEPGVTWRPLQALLPAADVVTLHVDLNPGTRRMFGEREFGMMKPGAWFVNTARGELIDETSLLAALESGHLAGAALDVVADSYGSAWSSPLQIYAATHDNLIVTPHIGGFTVESLEKTEIFLTERLLARLPGPITV